MKNEVYSYESLMNELKESDKIVRISCYTNDMGHPLNFMYYKGKFCEYHGFNLCANFVNYKIEVPTIKSVFKKCASLKLSEMDFSDERMKNAFNYDNFIKSNH